MPDVRIEIANLAAIKTAFNKAPQLMINALDKAIRKATLTIQRESMLNTPVDTGRLRASTYSRFQPLTGIVGTNVDYGIFVHEGTRFMPARPFLRDAVENSESDVQQFFTQAVDSVLLEIGRST